MNAEDTLALHLMAIKADYVQREYRFTKETNPLTGKPARWRFDFAFPERGLAVEVEGGIYTRGRHTRPKGFLSDLYKYNAALMLGWRVYRCTPDMVESGQALMDIERLLERSGGHDQ